MMRDTAPVYVFEVSRPRVRAMVFATQRIRAHMRVEQVTLRAITTEEYERAICAALPRKKSELGTPEV